VYRPADLGRAAFLAGGARLDRKDVAAVCAALVEHGDLALRKLASLTGLSQPVLLRVVAALEAEDVIVRRRGRPQLLKADCDPDTVSLDAEARRSAYETSRLAMMRSYAEAAGCRRELILNYFGEAYDSSSCRRCDNSLTVRAAPTTASTGPLSVGMAVRHAAWGDGIVERRQTV
jgi:ATP-dependent DNA helicase RecQ